MGERRRRWADPEERPKRLALIDPKSGDVNETHHVRSIRTECGHDLAAIGVTRHDGRPVLTGKYLT